MARQRKDRLPEELRAMIPDPGSGVEGKAKAFFVCYNRRVNFENAFLERYLRTKNPLAVWDCFLEARKRRKPIPEFVLEYFDRCADKLLHTDNQLSSIPECLEFNSEKRGGGHGDFKQYETELMQWQAVFEVEAFLSENPGMTVQEAAEAVSEKHPEFCVSSDTILKWRATIEL